MAQEPLETVLTELESLLAEEHSALKTLDYVEIERIADAKMEMLRRLSKADRSVADKTTLRRTALVRQKALNNQLLMVHARDLIRGVIDAVHPAGYQPPGFEKPSQVQPRLLAVRG